MRHSASRELFDYWNRLRAGRRAPLREEIEPSDIRGLLCDTFILEISAPLRTICYRLAGTRICATFGRELKGYAFLAHWNENDGFEVTRLLSRVYRDFTPALAVMRGYTESGRHADFEMILLPLEPMPDGSARIIGISTVNKDQYWLGAEPVVDCHLRSVRSLESEMAGEIPGILASRETSPPLAPDLDVCADIAVTGDQSAGRTSRRVAHLTVHDGGKQ